MRLKTIFLALISFQCIAQTAIINTSPAIFIDASSGVHLYSDTLLNVTKTYSLVGSDSAVQATAGNQPRIVSMGAVKSFEHTAANKDQLIFDQSVENIFKGSFSISVIVQPFSGQGAVGTYVGVYNGDIMHFSSVVTSGKVKFQIQTGAKSVQVQTLNPVFGPGEDFVPKMLTVVYDRTIKGVGGLVLYEGTTLLPLDATLNGNTSTYTNDSLFNPASGIGIGCRNRVTPDQAFGGRIGGVVIYDRVVDSCTLAKIEDYYTDTLTTSIYGLLNNTIECWMGLGQSNMVGFAPQAQFPSAYTGIQWGAYSNFGSVNTIQPIKYASGNWGSKFILWRKLADYREKPVLFIQAAVSNTGLYYSSTLANWNVDNTADSGSVQILTKRNIDSSLVILGRIQTAVWNNYKHHVEVKGVIWLGGETDAASTLANAQATCQNFYDMRAYYRDKLNNDTLPFVIANIRYPIKVNTPVVQQCLLDNSNQTSTAYSDSLTDIFSTTDCTQLSDSVHFNGPGQEKIADRFFNLIKLH